jgi:general secretion pathway protein E
VFPIRSKQDAAAPSRVQPLLARKADGLEEPVAPIARADTRGDSAVIATNSAVIESRAAVPPYQMVLTGVDAPGGLRLSKEIEYSLVAIELGPKRAMILYDPKAHAAVRRVIGQVRAALVNDSYVIEQGERQCSGEVIKAIVDNERGKGTGANDGVGSLSQGRALWESWVNLAVKERATDLHVEIIGNKAQVRARVDGDVDFLRDDHGGVYTAAQAEMAMSWAYNIASGKGANSSSSFDKSAYLYTMIQPRDIEGKKIALRYQSARGWQGPKVVARILNVDTNVPTIPFADLGYERSQQAQFTHAANRPSGLILIAGVTGSGKTTTLKTFIETHPGNGTSAFYSVEDPVEYPLRGVHQISLQRDLSNEEEALRQYQEVVTAMMRMDLDAALMGEMRDRATAAAAQQIVETGHMAAGTVHAHLISGIIPRLTNEQIGMSREVLTGPNMLTLLAYQALVPKLCQCAIRGRRYPKNLHDSSHVHDLLDVIETRFQMDPDLFRFRNKDGCEVCSRRGTNGLTVVAEMLVPDRKWLELTREHRDYEALQHYRSASDGRLDSPHMDGKTVFEHALYKAQLGMIDPRQCERFDSFDRFEIVLKPQPAGANAC